VLGQDCPNFANATIIAAGGVQQACFADLFNGCGTGALRCARLLRTKLRAARPEQVRAAQTRWWPGCRKRCWAAPTWATAWTSRPAATAMTSAPQGRSAAPAALARPTSHSGARVLLQQS